MKLRQFVINLAVSEAKKSPHNNYKLGCVIFNKKRILSVAHNKPFSWSSKVHPRFKNWPTSIHAEVAAIISARTELKDSKLLIVRINKANQLRLAKPCKHCLQYINYVGIRIVYYSISEYPYFDSFSVRH